MTHFQTLLKFFSCASAISKVYRHACSNGYIALVLISPTRSNKSLTRLLESQLCYNETIHMQHYYMICTNNWYVQL